MRRISVLPSFEGLVDVELAERTVSGVHLGQGSGGFAQHNGDIGVVLLHRGVRAREE